MNLVLASSLYLCVCVFVCVCWCVCMHACMHVCMHVCVLGVDKFGDDAAGTSQFRRIVGARKDQHVNVPWVVTTGNITAVFTGNKRPHYGKYLQGRSKQLLCCVFVYRGRGRSPCRRRRR